MGPIGVMNSCLQCLCHNLAMGILYVAIGLVALAVDGLVIVFVINEGQFR